MRYHAIGLALAAVLACCTHPQPAPAPPETLDGGHATCQDVCDRWAALHCQEGAIPARCLAACSAVQMHPEVMVWNLDCRARVASCDEIDRCP
jgi:hypothetical protein